MRVHAKVVLLALVPVGRRVAGCVAACSGYHAAVCQWAWRGRRHRGVPRAIAWAWKCRAIMMGPCQSSGHRVKGHGSSYGSSPEARGPCGAPRATGERPRVTCRVRFRSRSASLRLADSGHSAGPAPLSGMWPLRFRFVARTLVGKPSGLATQPAEIRMMGTLTSNTRPVARLSPRVDSPGVLAQSAASQHARAAVKSPGPGTSAYQLSSWICTMNAPS